MDEIFIHCNSHLDLNYTVASSEAVIYIHTTVVVLSLLLEIHIIEVWIKSSVLYREQLSTLIAQLICVNVRKIIFSLIVNDWHISIRKPAPSPGHWLYDVG